jgi:two-component system, cell cycle sensor histidine kinase and response regulator CckA
MDQARASFGHFPVDKKLLVVVSIFVAIVLCVFYVGALRSEILSGIRAYVGGEGLWSKAEKRAVLNLTTYAASRSESDYQQYLENIAIPLGDQQARMQLELPNPDMRLVSQGFVEGRNSPDDVKNMAMLFRRFRHVGYMSQAIEIWTTGDRYIDQLRQLSEQLHREVSAASPDTRKIRDIAEQIEIVDARLTPLEDQFSATLGQGARWMSHELSIITYGASGLLLLLGIGLSVGVLRQMHESEEKYRNLINTANDAILLIDADKRIILGANHKACELLGRSETELLGMEEAGLYPAERREQFRQILTLARGGSARGQELELLSADGKRLPVEVSASATEWSGRRAVLGIFRDIRDRVEAAAVLRRSEERFSYLIQNLSDVITVVAVDGTMLYHSPSLTRVTGYQPSELLGQSLRDFVHPDDAGSVQSALERLTVAPGTATPPEFRFRHRDGHWIWLEAVGNNLLNDAAVGGIVVTSRDVTGRRVLEEQVRQSQKMEAVGRLAGGIAHDFNNLLMVIRGYGEIALHQLQERPQVRQSVETIVHTTESAAKLTRQLLSFSRRHVFSPQVVNLNRMLEEVSKMLGGVLGEEIELSVKLSSDLGSVNVDPGQIEQVIMNLAVNARDAMPQGGKLRLRTENVDVDGNRAGRPPVPPPGRYVMLAVSDTGVGMDAETKSRIFEPFFTTKSKDEGSGLGLSVVYNIVKESGGHLWVQSEPGRGATFQVFLPRIDAAASVRPLEVTEAGRGGTETILVAEDQPELRWMICQYLQDLGYSVLEAKDGTEAVELAEQYKGTIDVFLSDVVMPRMRGPEAAARLFSKRPEIKVIFMSGYTEGGFASDREEEQGRMAALLQKPFKLDRLASRIREVLETPSRPWRLG